MLNKNIIKINEFAKRHNLYRWASLIFAVVILVLSVVPGFGGGINSGIGAHGTAYFVFSFTVGLYFRAGTLKSPLLKGAVLAGFYGLIIEIVQFCIPYRLFELQDILINFCAALMAMSPGYVMIKKKLI